MDDFATFDAERPADMLTRRQRAQRVNSGDRGRDGLTDLERLLLMRLRQMGNELVGDMRHLVPVRKSA